MSAGDDLVNAIADAVAIRLERMASCNQRLMGIEKAAEYLGLTVDALRARAGRDIPCVRTDRYMRFDRRELDRWIDRAPREGV